MSTSDWCLKLNKCQEAWPEKRHSRSEMLIDNDCRHPSIAVSVGILFIFSNDLQHPRWATLNPRMLSVNDLEKKGYQ